MASMHPIESFFRPRFSTVLPSLVITGISAGLLYYGLICALDASGQCAQLPVAIQGILVAVLWPWGVMIRVFNSQQIALASIIGFALSFIWIFILACIVRWVVKFFRKKK